MRNHWYKSGQTREEETIKQKVNKQRKKERRILSLPLPYLSWTNKFIKCFTRLGLNLSEKKLLLYLVKRIFKNALVAPLTCSGLTWATKA